MLGSNIAVGAVARETAQAAGLGSVDASEQGAAIAAIAVATELASRGDDPTTIGVAAKDCPLEGLLTPDKAATAWTVTSTQPGLPPSLSVLCLLQPPRQCRVSGRSTARAGLRC